MVIFMYSQIFETSVKVSNIAFAVGYSLAIARYEHRQLSILESLVESIYD